MTHELAGLVPVEFMRPFVCASRPSVEIFDYFSTVSMFQSTHMVFHSLTGC
jgi:hypothetical protein